MNLKMKMNKYNPIIGLEIHLQVKTKSKIFCSCPNDDAIEPNVNVCPICLGYPGAMPSLNKYALIQCIKMGLAVRAKILTETRWDRKNYMYPDLFKGYQITQYDNPVCKDGVVNFVVRDRQDYYNKQSYTKQVGIFRINLEEDTAKSIHVEDKTLIDANKAGVPLLEIVTKPEMYSVNEAVSFAKFIRNLARWFNVSECNMELGHMRFDVNISLGISTMPDFLNLSYDDWKGKIKHTPIVEIKNLNSFASLEKAILHEIERQEIEFEKNGEFYSPGNKETRGWDENNLITYRLRSKEEAEEYRYVPEPDIPIVVISDEDIKEISSTLDHNPMDLRLDLIKYGISEYTVDLLLSDKKLYTLFHKIVCDNQPISVIAANAITNELINEVSNLEKIDNLDSWVDGIRDVLLSLYKNTISKSQFKEILRRHKIYQNDWINLLSSISCNTVNDALIEEILTDSIKNNPKVVDDIKRGKTNAKMFFVGIVMKRTKGSADPDVVIKILDKLLEL